MIVLDALKGQVLLEPERATISEYEVKLEEFLKSEKQTAEYLGRIPLVASGRRFSVGLNIGSTEPDEGFKYVDFVGLFHTEFLYMESEHMPRKMSNLPPTKKCLPMPWVTPSPCAPSISAATSLCVILCSPKKIIPS